MTLDFTDLRAGRQCRLRAWQARHLAPPEARNTIGSPAIEALQQVAALARTLFPDAIDAHDDGASEDAAVERTRELMAGPRPRIWHAAVRAGMWRVRVDLLEPSRNGRWIAVLVRTGTRISGALADRAAFTLYVLREAGIDVAAVHALLLDPAYTKGVGPVDPPSLFIRRSLSFPARRRLTTVAGEVAAIGDVLASPTPPLQDPGAQCREDRDGCPFLAQCTSALPDDWTGWAPRKDQPPIRAWLSQGYVRLADLPDTPMLTRPVANAVRASRAGGRHVSESLAASLATAGPPAFYLDFECVAPAVPIHAGTTPYETIPFLWSAHHDDGAGTLTHVDDIAPPDGTAPLRRVADGLIDALGRSDAPILVYSSYEEERLLALEHALPDLALPLGAIRERLVDLLPVIREHVYDLRFRGSFSIKQVATVLVPALTYSDLSIRDGLTASTAYEGLLASGGSPADVAQVMQALREYCARDTLALVHLHRALRRLANLDAPTS